MDETALQFGWRSGVLAVLIVQLLALAGVLAVRGPDHAANRILAALLVVIGAMAAPAMLGFAGFYDVFAWLSFAPFQTELFVGPLIFAYFTTLVHEPRPRAVRLSMAPGAVYLAYQLYWFVQPLEDKWRWVAAAHAPFVAPAATALAIALAGAGLVLSARAILGYRARLAARSSAKAAYDLRGALFMLALLAAPFAAFVALDAAEALTGRTSYAREYPLFVGLALCGCMLAVAALAQPAEGLPRVAPAPRQAPESRAGQDPDPDWAAIAGSLRAQLQAEGWHLEPRLSLSQLCSRSGLSEYYVSRAINLGAGVNFNRFVNTLRIDAVKARLEAGAPDLLGAALDCGFNSKASFNRVFREITGETPSAYRKRTTGVQSSGAA